MGKKYYHSVEASEQMIREMEPSGYYEKVGEEGGCPEPLFGDIGAGFRISKIPELAFSKSIAGVVVAAANTQCWIGQSCAIDVYETEESPDIDLSDCPFDFHILEEVRYRRTIPVTKGCTLVLNKELVRQIHDEGYGGEEGGLNEESLECIRDFVGEQLREGKAQLKALQKDKLDECFAEELGLTLEELREYMRIAEEMEKQGREYYVPVKTKRK